MIASLDFKLPKHVLTHKEYDKEKWKDDCSC